MLEEDDIMLRAYAENAPGSFAQGFSSTDGFCDLVNVTSPLLSKKVLGTSCPSYQGQNNRLTKL
jgi:hypothetical protein